MSHRQISFKLSSKSNQGYLLVTGFSSIDNFFQNFHSVEIAPGQLLQIQQYRHYTSIMKPGAINVSQCLAFPVFWISKFVLHIAPNLDTEKKKQLKDAQAKLICSSRKTENFMLPELQFPFLYTSNQLPYWSPITTSKLLEDEKDNFSIVLSVQKTCHLQELIISFSEFEMEKAPSRSKEPWFQFIRSGRVSCHNDEKSFYEQSFDQAIEPFLINSVLSQNRISSANGQKKLIFYFDNFLIVQGETNISITLHLNPRFMPISAVCETWFYATNEQ